MEQAAYLSMRDLQTDHWWFVGRRRFLAKLIERRFLPFPNAQILEAGCGYGGNLEFLQQYGDVSAFEFDDHAREFASRESGIPVEAGRLPEAPGFDESHFHLIAILDVLEHLEDDHGSLIALRDRLDPKGSLLVTVPAVPWLWSKHDEIHHHKRRYTAKQLRNRLCGAGFEVEDIGYFNTLLFPMAVAQRTLSKLTGNDTGTEELPGPINALFKSIFSIEAHLAGLLRLPIGLSLYALARRER